MAAFFAPSWALVVYDVVMLRSASSHVTAVRRNHTAAHAIILVILVCPAFRMFMLLCLHERSTLAPVFTNQKKPEENVHFYEKAEKENSICFDGVLLEGAGTLSTQSGTAKLLPQEPPRSASQHQTAMALNCVCKHLCFISIYFVHSCFYYMFMLF